MKEIHNLLFTQIEEHFGSIENIPDFFRPFIHAINESFWKNENSGHSGRHSKWDKEMFLLDFYHNTEDGIIALDTEYTIINTNPAVETKYSYALPLAGKKCFEVYFKSKTPCPQCPVTSIIQTGKPAITVVQKASTNGDISGWAELHCFPITDSVTGMVSGVVEYVRDISENRVAEEALRKSEDLYRVVFENTGIAAIVIDADGTITLANSGFEKLSGFSREELENKKRWTEFFSLIDVPNNQESDDSSYFFPPEPLSYECKFLNHEGAVSTVINSIRTIPGTRHMVASVLDITDTKRLQSQLIHAEKMEAIGALAGGIAHDFNNLLMSIQGYTSLMLLDNSLDSGTYNRLKGIEEHVKSGADLTRQLLGYAQGGKYQVRPINLNDVVDKTATMFGRTKKEIAIHKVFQEDLWIVEADQGEIERVLLNFFVNAWQAMAGGGDLYLDTKNVYLDRKNVQPYGLSAGRYVRVSTTDTGMGMDSKTMGRIFEPFFTTREMGRGTGLGLASAYGIIKGHGGIINVYSEKGKGSTFSIYLPASRKKIVAGEKAHNDEPLAGTECVLLIDDEPSILEVGKQILELLGYRVFAAHDGSEAVEIFREHKSVIDIVILDMIMPHMGGGETFDMLKSMNPDVRVILSSGYSMTGEADEIVERGCKGFIQKPFTSVDLSKLLREVLDAR